MTRIKTYSELIKYESFEERFEYLRLCGAVGEETFGCSRLLNQRFYRSQEWKSIRDFVIIRDNGCDLGMADRPILKNIHIHHLNPIRADDIIEHSAFLIDPEYLICVSHNTHNAIHYGDESLLLSSKPTIRTKNDMCPWRRR